MPKRKTDPATGEPELTCREERFVDEFIANGGNASSAAASAGYGAARADQSAYQVLRRPEVQHRIRLRIAESRVTADEIIGTLASLMRGTLADFLDESGNFSIEAAKQRGVDHLLKTITTTTREINATKNKPAEVVRTCRGQLYSPIQAATALARILGIDSKRGRFTSLVRENQPLSTAPSAWLEDFIERQMAEQQLPREAVVECLLQVRPEIVIYLQELPPPQNQPVDLESPDAAPRTAVTLDFITSASTNQDPVGESARQINAISQLHRDGVITAEALDASVNRITNRLSEPHRNELVGRLQLEAHLLEEFAAADSAAELARHATAQSTPQSGAGPASEVANPAPPGTTGQEVGDMGYEAADSQAEQPNRCHDLGERSTAGDLAAENTQRPSNAAKPGHPRDVPLDRGVSMTTPPSVRDSKPTTAKYSVLPGLERYLLPTDYITPIPSPWPPTGAPINPASVPGSPTPVSGLPASGPGAPSRRSGRSVGNYPHFYGRAVSPEEEEIDDSQSFSMFDDFDQFP